MRPETEYNARTLANLILNDDGRHEGSMLDVGVGRIDVEMTGMVRTIRRQLMLQNAEIATLIADQIEAKAGAVNLQKTIETAVAKEVQRALDQMERWIIERTRAKFNQWIEDALREALAGHVEMINRFAYNKVMDIVDNLEK